MFGGHRHISQIEKNACVTRLVEALVARPFGYAQGAATRYCHTRSI
jgi:hypothetical protein